MKTSNCKVKCLNIFKYSLVPYGGLELQAHTCSKYVPKNSYNISKPFTCLPYNHFIEHEMQKIVWWDLNCIGPTYY